MEGFRPQNLKLKIIFNVHNVHISALLMLHNTTISNAIHHIFRPPPPFNLSYKWDIPCI